MPTGLIRLSNGSILRREFSPQRFALDDAECKEGASACCFFRDIAPDCLKWTLSGSADGGNNCSCQDGDYYLGWEECSSPNACNWWNAFSCTNGQQPGCLPAFDAGYTSHGIGAALTCTSVGNQPRISVFAGKDTGTPSDVVELYYKELWMPQSGASPDTINWPLCSDFSLTLTKSIGAPLWLPDTSILRGSNGSTPTDLDDYYYDANVEFWGDCDNCGEPLDQYEATLSGFSCSCLNDTFTLTRSEAAGCGGSWWTACIASCINNTDTCLFLFIGASLGFYIWYGCGSCICLQDPGSWCGAFSSSWSKSHGGDCVLAGGSLSLDFVSETATGNACGASSGGSVTIAAP